MPSREVFFNQVTAVFPDKTLANQVIEIHEIFHRGDYQTAVDALDELKGFIPYKPEGPQLNWDQKKFFVTLCTDHIYPLSHEVEPLTNIDEAV